MCTHKNTQLNNSLETHPLTWPKRTRMTMGAYIESKKTSSDKCLTINPVLIKASSKPSYSPTNKNDTTEAQHRFLTTIQVSMKKRTQETNTASNIPCHQLWWCTLATRKLSRHKYFTHYFALSKWWCKTLCTSHSHTKRPTQGKCNTCPKTPTIIHTVEHKKISGWCTICHYHKG